MSDTKKHKLATSAAMSSFKALAIYCVSIGFASSAFALGFGEVRNLSPVGAPFQAEVKLIGVPEEFERDCFDIWHGGSSEGARVRFARIQTSGSGNRAKLIITSQERISEPVVNLGIEAKCGYSVRRDYKLILPEATALSGIEAPKIVIEQTKPARKKTSSSKKSEPAPAKKVETKPAEPPVVVADASVAAGTMTPPTAAVDPLAATPVAQNPLMAPLEGAAADPLASNEIQFPPLRLSQSMRPAGQPDPLANITLNNSGINDIDNTLDHMLKSSTHITNPEGTPKAASAAAKPVHKEEGIDWLFWLRLIAGIALVLALAAVLWQRFVQRKAAQLTEDNIPVADNGGDTTITKPESNKAQAAASTIVTPTKPQPAPTVKPAAPAAKPAAPANSSNVNDSSTPPSLSAAAIAAATAGTVAAAVKTSPPPAATPQPVAAPTPPAPAKPAAPPPERAAMDFNSSSTETQTETRFTATMPAFELEMDPTQSMIHAAQPEEEAESVAADEHESAIELAEIMMSFGRVEGATQTLSDYIRNNPRHAVTPWLKLLAIYRNHNMREEFDTLTRQLNTTFNVRAISWEDYEVDTNQPVEKIQSIEEFPHLLDKVVTNWGTIECQNYLHQLLRDNRGGERVGFPLSVIDEILTLYGILDERLGKNKPA